MYTLLKSLENLCIHVVTSFFVGMLSKSMGQILRVSASMHILFHLGEDVTSSTISQTAIEAAVDLIEVCCQHTAYITGRGNLSQEQLDVQPGLHHLPTFFPIPGIIMLVILNLQLPFLPEHLRPMKPSCSPFQEGV